MTTPAPVLYASISDLRLMLDSTDAGTGTAAQLSDEQLTLALRSATDRVSTYAGVSYDPAASPPTMPGIVRDITLDLAAWWATTYYLKQKEMGANHPAVLRYTAAMGVLDAIRKGEIILDPASGGAAASRIINSIPAVFTGDDSTTAILDGQLQVVTPADMWTRPRIYNDQWLEYTG
ncbi:MAG TPA: phage protein Gp36 family protein [Streptosporangiaceae bacterium]|nr:phage protein Gp36 family protein [Streptosporangiaceae bacterium]